MREIDPMDDPYYDYPWEDEQEQPQHNEDCLLCVECGTWGREENGQYIYYRINIALYALMRSVEDEGNGFFEDEENEK